MEKIVNYKLKDFLKIKDEQLIDDYLLILDSLRPLKQISNPNYNLFNKQPKKLDIKAIRELTFGDVINVRNWINEASIESIFEVYQLITGLTKKQILNLGIIQFYGIFSFIKNELEEIGNIEVNELSDEDDFDINIEAVNAKQRMSRFGVLNTIDSLANGDILKWEHIQKLPYLTVLSKLIMDNLKNKIQKEISELQKKQLKN